ncbi:MAG: ABC transporter permease subunit, partial [Clostridia bacterium]|nr:ABC transporter permease subunit [Clostridia bacterium]
GNTTDYKFPKGAERIISLQKKDGETYITTDGGELFCFSGQSEKWKAEVAERTSDVIITENAVIVSYVSARNVDVFDRANGEKTASVSVPYSVNSVDVYGNTLFIAARRGGLKGSNVYRYPDYTDAVAFDTAAFSEIILDLAVDAGGTLYAVSNGYSLYKFGGAGFTATAFGAVRYEPFAVGFAGGKLLVADTVGGISVFGGDALEREINLGMTLCAFGANDAENIAAAANISGTVAVIDFESGKIRKHSAPTEAQYISVNEGGFISVSEYRSFTTKNYDVGKIATSRFFSYFRWVALVLCLPATVFLTVALLKTSEKGAAIWKNFFRKFRRTVRKSWKSLTFILPTFVLLGTFMYVPAIWGLCLSFFDHVPGVYSRFVGFDNFRAVLSDPWFMNGIGNMVILLITDLVKAIIPALMIAELIIALKSAKSQYWIRVLIYIPGILPGVAVLLIWTNGIYGDNGLLNSVLDLFGAAHVDWLGNKDTALTSLIMIGLPWVGQYILFYGALMSIPSAYKEAAKLDGCNWFMRIIYVDIPMIKPQLKYVFVISFINSIQDFGRIYMTTGQTEATNIPALQMYMTMNSGSGYGRAAAMGMLLFIVVFGATLINFRARKASAVEY